MAAGTPITLDKPRVLRFTIDEVEALEQRLGVGLDQLWANKQRIVALVALLYHGLRHEDATLTERKVKSLLQRLIDRGGDVAEVNETVLEALFGSGVYGRRMVEQVDAIRAEADSGEVPATVDPPPESDADA